MPADAGPNVEPQRVLWLWFSLGWLANFPIASAAELLEGNWAFVAENDVFERILSVYHSLREFEAFDFVYFADQLAVLGVLKSPPLFFTRSPHRGGMTMNAAFGELLLILVAGSIALSFLRIWDSMKSLTNLFSFLGRPHLGRLSTELVRFIFLMILATLAWISHWQAFFSLVFFLKIATGCNPFCLRARIRERVCN